MRWCAALVVVLVVLVVLTIKVGTRKPKRILTTDEETVAEVETRYTAPPVSSVPWARPAARPVEARRDRIGVARLKGRVLPPDTEPGEDGDEQHQDLGGISVTADDGSRTFSARMLPDARYSFHLPPGVYTLVAYDGELVGVESNLRIEADKERDVDIRLGPGAAISGNVHAPDGASVTVSASLSGSSNDTPDPETVEGDAFSIRGLVIGRRYDLVFSGPTVRTTTLRGIPAPAQGLDVVLAGAPIVRGAIGFPRGEKCPINQVTLRKLASTAPEDEGADTVDPDRECRFEVGAPGDTSEVMVVATGPGWFLEERVRIPAIGDPEPVCLNPPCRADPLEGLARLRVAVDGLPAGARINANASSSGSYDSCGGSSGWCEMEGLTPGEQFLVGARGEGCRSEARSIVLTPGSNSVSFSCQRERRINGVVRLTTGTQPRHLSVRCRGSEARTFGGGALVFHLKCGTDVSDVEYSLDSGPWQSVPIPRGDQTAPALVEITL